MLASKPSIAAQYAYSVVWSPEDEEFVATVAEFPSLSWMDDDQIDALAGLRTLVQEVLEDMQANGEEVPKPLMERAYSGNIKLRVSPEKHRDLSRAAAQQGVSLNRYLSERLA